MHAACFTQTLIECRETSLVGGKAANLGQLARAGFPVPGGFVVTTQAYWLAREEREKGRRGEEEKGRVGEGRADTAMSSLSSSPPLPFSSSPLLSSPPASCLQVPPEVAEEIRAGYRAIGGGAVAVRSSATAEDMAAASMAGQYDTFLDVDGEAAVVDAVRRCWAGLDSPRTLAYLGQRGIDPRGVAMAVIVERLIPADVAGVLFTTNPHGSCQLSVASCQTETTENRQPTTDNCQRTTASREMLIEASWGLGEMVVSGQVQPDALRLDYETGRVLAATIADKQVRATAGASGPQPVDDNLRRRPCLSGREVHRLWQLGRRAVEHFRTPQDIEWAIHGSEIYVLQSRPITTLQEAEASEEILCATRQRLGEEAAAGRGPWVLHNLAETLPHPTPLAWSVIGRFMSGCGGFGTLYRQAGFEPSPAVYRDGFLERLAGRVYMDASRAPEMFFQDFPFAYDPEELKRDPDASQTPPTLPRGSAASRWKAGRRLAAAHAKLRALAADFDRRLREDIFPGIARYVADAKQTDLTSLSAGQLVACWEKHEKAVLDTFGPHSLMPGLISAMAIADLRAFLAENFWDEDPDVLARSISSGGPPDRTVLRDAQWYELGKGERPLETWLAEHGHRGPGEFDLASPRWREQPEIVCKMAAHLAAGESPLVRHRRNADAVGERVESLCRGLCARDRKEFDRRIDLVRRYIAFREDGKDFLMLGYDLLRDVAIEAGRRLDVGQDVFFLTRDDLFDALRVGFAPYHLIEQRKIAHRAEERLKLPRVIGSCELSVESCQREITDNGQLPTDNCRAAMPISAGEASGPARILTSPTEVGNLGRGYILVCPSTDPSWTPLFAGAAGLVLERGGMLSHGAVVAREMGLPAVVLPDATRLFRDGEEVRVDGYRGAVVSCQLPVARDAGGCQLPTVNCQLPTALPPPGRKDRVAARVRNILAAAWTAYLLACFLLPAPWVYEPTLSAADFFLWPVVRALGKPGAVAVIAAAIAMLALAVQKLATDNRRLLEAKRRAAALGRLARTLPKDSPQRAALLRAASPVPLRTLGAAMVPVGILLGPMVIPFVWFSHRVDPSVESPPAGSAVQVVATVQSDWSESVRIEVPPSVLVDDTTPAALTLPPLRKTLERLLALYRQPRNDRAEPWELTVAPDLSRQQTADDLQAYLAAGIPPQAVRWMIRPPEDVGGTFPVAVMTTGHAALTLSVVLGEEDPPAPRTVQGAPDSPIREVRVVYAQPKLEPVFWRPLACLEGAAYIPCSARLTTINVGWLTLYILVYIPVLLLVRPLWKVA